VDDLAILFDPIIVFYPFVIYLLNNIKENNIKMDYIFTMITLMFTFFGSLLCTILKAEEYLHNILVTFIRCTMLFFNTYYIMRSSTFIQFKK